MGVYITPQNGWNFDKKLLMKLWHLNKLSLETFWDPNFGSLKYLRMHKLQFFNATYKLLTKFLIEKVNRFHFFNFLTRYEVQTYTGNILWQMKLIGGLIKLIKYFCLVSGL